MVKGGRQWVKDDDPDDVEMMDRHVDGDVLLRLLERGGVGLLRRMLEEEAGKVVEDSGDRIGLYVRRNLGKELDEAEAVVEEIRTVLAKEIL